MNGLVNPRPQLNGSPGAGVPRHRALDATR
jgi:hypothetical protein